jgi:hypothetical protein
MLGWALHAIVFLAIRALIPQAIEIAAFVLLLGLLFSNPWISIPRARKISAYLFGFLLGALIHILIYEGWTRLKFNFSQIYDNPKEAWLSGAWVIGEFGMLILIGEFFLMGFLLGMAILKISKQIPLRFPQFPWKKQLGFICTVGLLAPALMTVWSTLWSFTHIDRTVNARWNGDLGSIPQSNESLIVLQLESVNGSALYEESMDGIHSVVNLPGFEKMQNLGAVWYPYFWSNAFGTHFGMLNILCGTSGVTGSKIVPPPEGYMCMPERFKKAGFETVFYYSFSGPGFYNLLETVNKAGFQHFLYGDKLMKPEDPFYEWGYEDCHFYRRAFDHLRVQGWERKEKMFIYLSVHANHFPFQTRLPIKHPFMDPKSDLELYLNSASEQDHCLGEFLDQVQSLKRDDLNLLVVGDHSFPLNKDKGVFDGFTTSLFFLPSKNRRHLFPPGPRQDVRPSQDQIQNTVLELFDASRSDSSFYWSLRGETKPTAYENCHLVTDFGPGVTFVTDGQEIVERSLKEKKMRYLKLINNTPKEISQLDSVLDWQKVHLKTECLRRLGIKGD